MVPTIAAYMLFSTDMVNVFIKQENVHSPNAFTIKGFY